MDNFATLFLVFWVVLSVVVCVLFDILFPKRKYTHRTTGYLVKDVWMYDDDYKHWETYRATYRFTINGKEYKKTFRMSSTPEYEMEIAYSKGKFDAKPANRPYDGRTRLYIKVLLCVFVVTHISVNLAKSLTT